MNGQSIFSLNGDAANLGNGEFRLTSSSKSKVGSIWFNDKVSLNESFELNFELYFGTRDNGADGMTFCLQRQSTSVGVKGSGLGVGGVSPSFFVEFDTYRNGGEVNYDHLAIQKNGSTTNSGTNNLVSPVQIEQGQNNVEDGQWHPMRITWDAPSKTFKVYVSCNLRATYTGDIVNSIFSGDPNVFWGFTASTGGAYNEHKVRNITSDLVNLSNQQICKGGSKQITIPPTGYSFTWSPTTGINNLTSLTPTFSPVTTTEYIITYQGLCNTTLKDTFTVTVNEPSINLGNDTTICTDSTLMLVSQNNTSYLWNTGFNGQALNVTGAGTYWVEVTDQFGCKKRDSVNVAVQNCVPNLISPDTLTICSGDSVDVSASNINTVKWSSNQGYRVLNDSTIRVSPNSTTKYVVSNFEKKQNTLINGSFEAPNIGSGYKIVDASSVNGWNTTASDNKMEIWYNGFLGTPAYKGNQFAELNANMSAALYQDMPTTPGTKLMWGFAHRGRNGIENMDFEIGTPGGQLVKIKSVSTGKQWKYYSGIYEVPAGQTTTRFYYSSKMAGGSGNLMDAVEFYTLEEQKDSVVIVVNKKPTVDLGGDQSICDGDSVILDAGNGYNSYSWSSSEQTQTLNVKAFGKYSVEVTTDKGCKAFDTITVSEKKDCKKSLCGKGVNYNNWNQTGHPDYGNWVVSADGNSVKQTINSDPTFYLGNQNLVDVRFTGNMMVGPSDDDWIGMVFGYVAPTGSSNFPFDIETIVLDWKQREQTWSGQYWPEGYSLFKVKKTINNVSDLRDLFRLKKAAAGEIEILATNYMPKGATGNGWKDNTLHQITVDYTSSNIKVFVDDNLIFDVDGCFQPGRIGFYNDSQGDVTYSNFTYQYIASITAKDTACVNESLVFQANKKNACSTESQYPKGTIYTWDFGDGTVLVGDSVSHTYLTKGTYEVKLTLSDSSNCISQTTKKIVIGAAPNINLGSDTSFCDTINLTLGKAIPNVDFLWSTGDVTSTIKVKSKGLYWVKASSYKCEIYDSIKVGLYDSPSLALSNDTAICDGDSLEVGPAAATNYKYLWSNGLTTNRITIKQQGKYSLQVENEYKCKTKDSIQLTVNPMPVVDLGNDTTICYGENVTLKAGNPGFKYKWNINVNTGSIAVSDAGQYSVIVYDALGCADSDTFELKVNALPVVDLGNDTTICDFQKVDLDAKNPGLNYKWNTGETSKSITAVKTGVYGVEVRDAIGCLGSDSMQITVNPLPVVDLGNDTTICIGEKVTIDAGYPNMSHQWSSGEKTQTININASGTYSVVVSDVIGCTGRDTFKLTINPLPKVSLGNDKLLCVGETTTLDAGNKGLTYLWNDGSKYQTLVVKDGGYYTVDVFDAIGCKGSDDITITMDVVPDPFSEKDKILCEGDTLLLGPDAGYENYKVSWFGDPYSRSISVTKGGDYYGIVKSIECLDTFKLTVTKVDTPDVSIFNPNGRTKFCFELEATTLDIEGEDLGFNYYWPVNGERTKQIDVTKAGIYNVEVSNQYCTTHTNFTFEDYCEGRMFIPSSFTPDDDGLNDEFMPKMYAVDNYEMYIFNRWGEQIFHTNDPYEGWNGKTPLGTDAMIDVYVYKIIYTRPLIHGANEAQTIIGHLTLLR